MRSGTTKAAQGFYSASRRFNNAGDKSAVVLPPVAPHACREEVRVCAKNGTKITGKKEGGTK